MQIHKILHSVKNIDQIRDDLTAFGALKLEKNNTIFFLLISTNFRKLPLAGIFKDQQMLPWFFAPLQTYFLLVIKFVLDGIKKCIRNCRIMLKKFLQHFFFIEN